MKRCPECRRDYFDDSLLYCLDDGSSLLEGPAPMDEPATAVFGVSPSGGFASDLKTESFENRQTDNDADSQRGLQPEGGTQNLKTSLFKGKFIAQISNHHGKISGFNDWFIIQIDKRKIRLVQLESDGFALFRFKVDFRKSFDPFAIWS